MQQFIKTYITGAAISFVIIACSNNETKIASASSSTSQGTSTPNNATSQNGVMGAVTADPAHYKLLKDSMGIRIVEVVYQPGDSSPLHSHHDYAFYNTQGGTVTMSSKDGSKMEITVPTGTSSITGAEIHSVKNTGKAPVRAILFEVTRPGKTSTRDTSLDATKVAPNNYKLLKDSLGIRVIEVHYKPGQSVGMHHHPDGAIYVIEGGTAELTNKDGSKRTVEVPNGLTTIGPAETHSVKNVGKKPFKFIFVEVDRPMK